MLLLLLLRRALVLSVLLILLLLLLLLEVGLLLEALFLMFGVFVLDEGEARATDEEVIEEAHFCGEGWIGLAIWGWIC